MRTIKLLKLLASAMAVSAIAIGNLQAQGKVFLEDVGGHPIKAGQYENISGSPYLQDTWSKGNVKVMSGEEYDNIPVKYDQVEDVLLFQNDKGETMTFSQPVTAFVITYVADGKKIERHYQKNFPPVSGATDQNFYEVLATGPAKLLERTAKVVRQEKTYNSATINKNILENTNYYINKGNSMTRIKNEKSVLEALGDKREALKSYINKNNINVKQEEDLVELVNYYNTLK